MTISEDAISTSTEMSNTRPADSAAIAEPDSTPTVAWCPFDVDHWSPALVGSTLRRGGQSAPARLVATSVDGDAICMAVDLDRRRNQRLLAAPAVQVALEGDDHAHRYAIDDIEPLAGASYEAAAQRVSAPLGISNALVHAHKLPALTNATDETEAAKQSRLVVPVASPCSVRRTQTVVEWLAQRLNWPVEYVYVSTPEMLTRRDVTEFAHEVQTKAASGIDVRARVIVSDDVGAAVVDACRDQLTCMETHATAYRGAVFVDSFAAGVLATSKAPVVLIGPRFDASSELSCAGLEIALAGERYEGKVLDAAIRWATRLGLTAGVMHVAPGSETEAVESGPHRREPPQQIPIDVSQVDARDDEVAQTLVDAAGTSWLAVGTHARRGLNRIAEGSVAFDVVAIASRPVVAFGPAVEDPEQGDFRTFDPAGRS